MTDQTDDMASAPAEANDDARASIWAELEAENAGRDGDDDDQHDDGADGDDDDAGADDQWGDGSGDGDEPDPDGDETGEDDADGAAPAKTETPEEQIARLEAELKSTKGRAKGQQRAAERARADAETVRQEMASLRAQIAEAEKSAPTTGRDKAALEKRREQLAEVAEEYDMIAPLAEIVADLEDQFAKREEEMTARERADLDAKRARVRELEAEQEAVFAREHPDGFDVIEQNADAFRGWIDDQPKAIRDAFQANAATITDGAQAAHLVALFKQSLTGAGEPQNRDRLASRRASQLQGSQTTRSGQATRPSATPGPDASREAAWAYYENLDRRKAQRGG